MWSTGFLGTLSKRKTLMDMIIIPPMMTNMPITEDYNCVDIVDKLQFKSRSLSGIALLFMKVELLVILS